MKKLLQSLITNIWFRFSLLVLSAVAGIVLLVVFTNYCENDPRMFSKLCQGSRFTASFKIILLGLPVSILLWYFKTLDTKKKLDKSEEQINQNNYLKGLDNLVSKEDLKIEIGVQQLIALSKVAKKYKEGIKLAFIKRLKSPLKKKEGKGRYFFYAQDIVDWLSKNYHSAGLDLSGCNFDYQEFKIKTNFDIFRNKENNPEQLSFVETNLNGANLSKANLNGTKLNEADLNGADLRGTKLSGADLSGADLRGTKLNGTKLNGADLRGADLHGTYLVETNLVGTNLKGADLVGTNLKGADLGGTNLKGVDFGGADLKGVDLSRADLSGADLREAGLNGADLNRANLYEAYLVEAYLEGADLRGAVLSGADLSKVNVQKEDYQEAGIYKTKFVGALFNKNQPPIGVNFEEWGYKLEDLVIGSTNFCQLVNKDN